MRSTISRQTSFTKRLKADFYHALLQALSQHRMEDLTISRLCAYANYPRSTFYKYYYDLEDLFTDYLRQVWQMLGVTEEKTFFDMALKLYDYQCVHAECNAVLTANRNSIMFRDCFTRFMRPALSETAFMEAAMDSRRFPSSEWLAEYVMRIFELLSGPHTSVDNATLRALADLLLKQPFSEISPQIRSAEI